LTLEAQAEYRGAARALLERESARVWSDVIIETRQGRFEGVVLPRSEYDDEYHIVLKLHNGYNTGLHVDSINSIKEVGYREAKYQIPESEFPSQTGMPEVTLFGTGGTIASRLDYRTGAVIPAFTPGELYGAVPELADICNLKTEKLSGIFSENLGPENYVKTALRIGQEIEAGVDGIVLGQGTDTMHHTGAILSYMIQNSPVPVVIVGSQRSSDRPSSDAALNLIHAVTASATGDIAEVMVCMFGPTSDRYGILHRGTRVRKMHSSYRDTFRTIGDIPLATITARRLKHLRHDFRRRRQDREVDINTSFEDRVAMIYYYPNMHPDMVEALIDRDYKGLIIAGTGLGHVNKPLYQPLERAVQEGMHVFMTVQTLWGFVQMYVYDTGRDLLQIGVEPLGNMLPEAAYMKLCWALGQSENRDEVTKIMQTTVAGELTPREPYNGFTVLQGGLPEVDRLLNKVA